MLNVFLLEPKFFVGGEENSVYWPLKCLYGLEGLTVLIAISSKHKYPKIIFSLCHFFTTKLGFKVDDSSMPMAEFLGLVTDDVEYGIPNKTRPLIHGIMAVYLFLLYTEQNMALKSWNNSRFLVPSIYLTKRSR